MARRMTTQEQPEGDEMHVALTSYIERLEPNDRIPALLTIVHKTVDLIGAGTAYELGEAFHQRDHAIQRAEQAEEAYRQVLQRALNAESRAATVRPAVSTARPGLSWLATTPAQLSPGRAAPKAPRKKRGPMARDAEGNVIRAAKPAKQTRKRRQATVPTNGSENTYHPDMHVQSEEQRTPEIETAA